MRRTKPPEYFLLSSSITLFDALISGISASSSGVFLLFKSADRHIIVFSPPALWRREMSFCLSLSESGAFGRIDETAIAVNPDGGIPAFNSILGRGVVLVNNSDIILNGVLIIAHIGKKRSRPT